MQAAAYAPPRGATRAAALSAIAIAHGIALAAFLSLGGAHAVIQHAQPLLVRFVPAPPQRPVEPVRAVPLPTMRPPEVRLPEPPPIELAITVRHEPQVEPVAPALVVAARPAPAAPVAPAPSPAPSLEPPRADLAYLNNPPPAYPAVSRRSGEQGRVMLRVRVSAEGAVQAIEVERSSGFERLDEAARQAVRRWKFVPAKRGERAVEGWALVPVNFTLRG